MNDSVSPVVHLVDDDEAVRDALALLLGTVGLRVERWPNARAFVDGFDRESIGAVVLDVRMPGESGLTLLEQMPAAGIDHPVILMTGHGTIEMCRRAFKFGAVEFLEKPVDDERLLAAVHEAIRAHVATRERLVADREARTAFARLSVREREILAHVVLGATNKQIARAIGLSPRTVETHRANLSAKLQVDSLAALIRGYAALVEALPGQAGGT